MILSIILPVYNVEDYLIKCLDSILHQEIDKTLFEVIIVNDGSTDNSLEICKKYEASFSNVSLIDQVNKGLSGARNSGIKLAKGEYIWFIDSDDWIEKESLKEITNKLQHKKLDVLAISSSNYINGEVVTRTSHDKNLDYISYLKSDKYNVGAVFYIFNRSIFTEFIFKTGLLHEDEEFNNKVLYKYKNIEFLKHNTYIVNQREGSITRSVNPKRAFDLLIVMDSLFAFMNEEVAKEHKIIFYNRISLLFNNALNNTLVMDKKTIDLFQKEVLKYPFIIECLKKSNVLKYKLEGFLMQLFPKKSVSIYKVLKKL